MVYNHLYGDSIPRLLDGSRNKISALRRFYIFIKRITQVDNLFHTTSNAHFQTAHVLPHSLQPFLVSSARSQTRIISIASISCFLPSKMSN